MKNRNRIIIIIFLLFSFVELLYSSTEVERFNARDPKSNKYSKKIENYLLGKEYIKASYDDFYSTAVFRVAYRDIYKEEYTNLLPTYVCYYKMKDKLWYCMLNDYKYKNDPPIMIFLILQKGDEKTVYYKINYNLDYELVKKPFYDSEQERTIMKTVKVFY
ncbi:MAG: hypothetical protein J6Y36_03155 [Treponema sp.]|nr:hypothetical protein [Treponema sp.]